MCTWCVMNVRVSVWITLKNAFSTRALCHACLRDGSVGQKNKDFFFIVLHVQLKSVTRECQLQ